MKTLTGLVFVLSLVLGAGACGDASAGARGDASAGAHSEQSGALHAVGQCFRQHGIPNFQDPVVASTGHVYYDSRSIGDAGRATADAALQACRDQMAAAGVSAGSQPPAPPQLVAAGVRAAQCLRANGLPAVRDPTPDTPFTPGHGFSLTDQDFGGSWPVGGKANPAVRAALQACRGLLDKEIEASTLSSLSHD